MPERKTIPLAPIRVGLLSDDYAELCRWPYVDEFVGKLLFADIPKRSQFGNCRIWIYRDPAGQTVGFGTLDLCCDYSVFTSGHPHPYIPLLAVNPTIKSLGYGTSILQHLIDEATLLTASPTGCYSHLYLDVYTSSEKAKALYTAAGFENITPQPFLDPQADGKPYIVMARRVAIARGDA
jgi:GNAT superfamily N-acetyltransferase